ncbi:uncharacterized protein LOC144620851 [Crassostrea virginica]
MFPLCMELLAFFFVFSNSVVSATDPAFALCDGQRGSIHCGKGTKIRILSANYGRTDGNICPGGNTAARTCRSKRTLTRVKWTCNGYRICHLHASNQLFGNPCVNVSKYLEVKYRCVKKSDGDFKAKQIIAFNAYISKHLTLHRDTPINVVYDAVYYNYGNAYNTHSGFFTAPSGGLYVFTWSSVVSPRKIFDAEILLNGQRRGLGSCNNELNPGYENCANTVPLVLKTGDKVNIRTTTANFLIQNWSSLKAGKFSNILYRFEIRYFKLGFLFLGMNCIFAFTYLHYHVNFTVYYKFFFLRVIGQDH